jgi:ActR/RegA family two-component response regulator
MNGMGVTREAAMEGFTRKALVVDDNSLLLHFTAMNLERDVKGLKVFTAASCQEARMHAAEHNFSVLIVDLRLGDGNGLDLIKELTGKQQGVRAILISGQQIPSENKECVFASVLKPYEAQTLADIVMDALEHYDPVLELEEEPPSISCAGYDRHRVENHLGSLLAGLRAFGKELRACSDDPDEVNDLADEYLNRLCGLVMDVSRLLPSCPTNLKKRDEA